MSLSSTTTIKNQLSTALGPKAPPYFSVLKEYLSGHISRTEYDDQVKTHLDSTHLGMASFGSARLPSANAHTVREQSSYITPSLSPYSTLPLTLRHPPRLRMCPNFPPARGAARYRTKARTR